MAADSYTSTGLFSHFARLRPSYLGKSAARADEALTEICDIERTVRETYGVALTNLDVLEVGPGQLLGQTMYLALKNRVTAVDRDVIAYRSPLRYIEMLRRNGIERTCKTLGRKFLGVDRQYVQRWKELVGTRKLPHITFQQGRVEKLPFADKAFDFVYSRAVFQHLDDPRVAIPEIDRVIKQGGIGFVSFQPYTSPTASLDPRVRFGEAGELGHWPHLRKETTGLVKANAPLNKFTMAQWRDLAHLLPESIFTIYPIGWKYAELASEVPGYSLEELTAGAISIMWKKSH